MGENPLRKCSEAKNNRINVTFDNVELEKIEELRKVWKTNCSGAVRKIVQIYLIERGYLK